MLRWKGSRRLRVTNVESRLSGGREHLYNLTCGSDHSGSHSRFGLTSAPSVSRSLIYRFESTARHCAMLARSDSMSSAARHRKQPKQSAKNVSSVVMVFNHNDGGRAAAGFKGSTGDCVTRAIAIATGTSYLDVYDSLNAMQKSMRQTKRIAKSSARTGVNRRIYELYLAKRGWRFVPTMSIGSGCKVHLKASELPRGNIIVRLSGHLAAVIDGIIQDTYDCSRKESRCVYGYYIAA